MSQDREPRYFDFIHQHEERLNLIYSRWEAQIAQQSSANQSPTLVGKIKSHRKTVLAGMAIAFGSAIFACHYGQQQLKNRETLIASNTQSLKLMNWELRDAATDLNKRSCIAKNDDIYQLTTNLNHRALLNQPRAFITQADTISVVRHSSSTQQPDIYFSLNPDRSLLFGSIEQTEDNLLTAAKTISLDRDIADFAGDKQAIDNHLEVQNQAIALHEELAQCYADSNLLEPGQTLSPMLFAD